MGRVILCTGRCASNAYCFESTNTRVYSIEELCYYIYHSIDTVTEELLRPELTDFIENELGLGECAKQLRRLNETHSGIKEVIETIFGATDYYGEEDIQHIFSELDYLNNMTPLQRKKRKADYYLARGQHKEAVHIYREILYSKEYDDLTNEEYGNIMHNIALIQAKAGAFVSAAAGFREAYARNNNVESLKQYLYALKLGHQDALFDKELRTYIDNKTLLDQIEGELFRVADNDEGTYEFHEVDKLRQMREDGRVAEYYSNVDEVIKFMKNKYREENG